MYTVQVHNSEVPLTAIKVQMGTMYDISMCMPHSITIADDNSLLGPNEANTAVFQQPMYSSTLQSLVTRHDCFLPSAAEAKINRDCPIDVVKPSHPGPYTTGLSCPPFEHFH